MFCLSSGARSPPRPYATSSWVFLSVSALNLVSAGTPSVSLKSVSLNRSGSQSLKPWQNRRAPCAGAVRVQLTPSRAMRPRPVQSFSRAKRWNSAMACFCRRADHTGSTYW